MARKRMLDPDSWTDDKIAELSIGAHLLWVGLISLADDDGRLQWSAKQFKIRLFPAKKATVTQVSAWMREIVTANAIATYTVDGKQYAAHPKWAKTQYVNRPSPSRFPAPPPGTHGFITHDSVITTELPGLFRDSQVPLDSDSDSDSESDTKIGTEPPVRAADAWVSELLAEVEAIGPKPIREWTASERVAAGRWHCLRFANCNKSEARNKARATNAASAFAAMARSKIYGDITLPDYAAYAAKVHESRENTPWYNPQMIRAVVEFAS